MSDFTMTCTCGDIMKVSAASRDEAVTQLKGMMTEEAIAQHMQEKHPGDAVPSVADVHAMIEKTTQAA